MEASTARERILDTSMKLFAKKGYKGTTTRQIAKDAGVSELTVFRHFGSKEGILRQLFQAKFQFGNEFTAGFKMNARYELVPDLINAATFFQQKLAENIHMVMIVLNEFDKDSEIADLYLNMPSIAKQFLIDYFEEMKKRGKFPSQNTELAAVTFLSMNIGFMIMKNTFSDLLTKVTSEEYVNTSIKGFAEHLVALC